MTEPRRRFQWYWLLEFAVGTCALALIFSVIMLAKIWLRIPVPAMVIAMVASAIGVERAYGYRDRLRERLGVEWIESPMSWKILWWSLTIVICVIWVSS